MGQNDKFLITEEGRFDLSAYRWDDQRFSDLLIRENPINTDQAMNISRFLRDEIAKMKQNTITMSMVEKIIEKKLIEYGLEKPSPFRFNKSIL